jgi:cysteine-S-conjugate beta-lyase
VEIDEFERLPDRRRTDSLKWGTYGDEVLPMWVADMDFPAPDAVVTALHQRIDHGVFGYAKHPQALAELICQHLQQLYQWSVNPEAILFTPGVVPAFNLAIRSLAKAGGELLIQTPVYPPFLKAASHSGLETRHHELTLADDHSYVIDFESWKAAVTPSTCAFLFCNPHNPVGRVFRQDELKHLAQYCLRQKLVIVSDEIHSDLVFNGQRHIPIASLDPEVERQTITLMAPSKTYNIAGLECSFAVIPNVDLRRRFETARAGLVPGANILGYVAAEAAYLHGEAWLKALLRYLEGNRDFLLEFAATRLPGITVTPLEGTFLAWMDCRPAALPGNPARFFLKEGGIALNDGKHFGPGGEGFVRLNFGCPRSILTEGLQRMAGALHSRALSNHSV